MSVKKFASDVIKEGKKVRWPKRDVLIPTIITVVVVMVFFAIILYLEDLAGNNLIEILRNAFSGFNNGGLSDINDITDSFTEANL